MRFQFITLMVFFATMGITIFLFIQIPKGFFPDQDTGLLLGVVGGLAGHLVRRDAEAHAWRWARC